MSKWLDNQKQSNSNFPKLLQERLKKANPRRKLNAEETKRLNKLESLCEDALEILQEILRYDSSLRIWFDRDISFEVGGDLSADIVSLPRLVTSRSHEKLCDDSRLTSSKVLS